MLYEVGHTLGRVKFKLHYSIINISYIYNKSAKWYKYDGSVIEEPDLINGDDSRHRMVWLWVNTEIQVGILFDCLTEQLYVVINLLLNQASAESGW